MKRSKHLPLTETVYYILLVLLQPVHGYVIIQQVEELSKGQVRLAAGTLYGAIENLLKLKFIEPVASIDKRRKVYQTTALGRSILREDMQRMQHMVFITETAIGTSEGE
ncbi:PadR family transcriptional regulator [Paenibacillaceae bacterium]|nr:PadR family transcriptional regulator [Paenibacillaceae bacterium]